MAWKRGPLPKSTWGYGGVVPAVRTTVKSILRGEHDAGFLFADFRGDHVKTYPDGEILSAEEIAFYNNDLQIPIKVED